MISLATSEKLVLAQGGLLGMIACTATAVVHLQPVNPRLSLSAAAARLDLASLSSNEITYRAFFNESNVFRVHLSRAGEEVCIFGVNREAWCRGHRNIVATGPSACG